MEKKLTQHHKIELIISIYADVDVNVNQWRHLVKVSAYCFGQNPGGQWEHLGIQILLKIPVKFYWKFSML